MKITKVSNIFNYIFSALVIIACVVFKFVFDYSWLTLISCISGIMYIVFLSDRNILNFIIGLISSTTYIIIAFNAKLFGEVIFYLIIDLPMILISFIIWKRNMETKLKVKSKKLSVKQTILICVSSIVVVIGYAFFLKAIGGVNVVVDAISTVVSFIATLLMALRYREQWIMWVIVYIVSIIMWATTYNLLMLLMSISCFVSCFVGFINWTLTSKKN